MLCLPQNDPQRNTRHAATSDSLSFPPFAGVVGAVPGVPGTVGVPGSGRAGTVGVPGSMRAPGAADGTALAGLAISHAVATGADRAGPTCRAGH